MRKKKKRNLYLPTYISFLSFFIPFYSYELPSITISLQPKQFLQVFLVIQFPYVGIFQFCSSENVFIPPLFLKTGFVQHGILCWVFPVNNFKMIFHCFLDAIVSDQQLSRIFIFLYITHCLSLSAFNVFSLLISEV